MNDKQLRIGIGKVYFASVPTFAQRPWYVTIYNRALTADTAQEWFATHPEAIDYASKMLPKWKARYAS